jgi:hypothetical protein
MPRPRVPGRSSGDFSSADFSSGDFSSGDFLPRITSALMRPWALTLLWLTALAYAVRFAIFILPAPPAFTDFNHYYTAALALRLGSNPYITAFDALARSFGLELSGLDIENQTPTFLLYFEPLTRLRPYTAYWIWVGISLTSLVVALYLLVRETSFDTRQALLFGALLFLYPPVYEHFYFANMQIAILLLIVIAIHYLERGTDRWAGLPLALATALKAYPVLLAVYLGCRKRWRTLFWMMIWGGIIGLLTLWGVGLVSFSFVKTFGFTTSRISLENPGFFSISSVVSHLFWHKNVPLAPSADIIRRAAIAIAELALFALTVSATTSAGPDRNWRALSLWLVAMILLSPIAEPHYLLLLMVPFAWIADAAARGEAGPRVIYTAVASYLVTFSRYPLTVLHHYVRGDATFFWVANQFWFVAAALAYLAAYWLATSQRYTQHDTSFVPAAAAASGAHQVSS